ncbi:hypothetical protein, partial [Desulfomarina sp.]
KQYPMKQLTPFIYLLFTLFFLSLTTTRTAICSIEDTPYDKAVAMYKTAVGEKTAVNQHGRPLLLSHKKPMKIPTAAVQPSVEGVQIKKDTEQKIRALSYTNLLIFRIFCTLPSIGQKRLDYTLSRLQTEKISFATTALLASFVKQPGADTDLTWRFLQKIKNHSFVTSHALSSLLKIRMTDARLLFPLTDQILELDEAGRWAVDAFLQLPGVSEDILDTTISLLNSLTDSQKRSAEQLCRIPGMDPKTARKGLKKIGLLSFAASWNSRAVFMTPGLTPHGALAWLTNFFSLTPDDRELRFTSFSGKKKKLLLNAYCNSSEKIIWRINNLHDITDNFGQEIGIGKLRRTAPDRLRDLFNALHNRARVAYRKSFNRALADGKKNEAVAVLALATERARRETAMELTGGNLYILLAYGNDFYDSSFRDIVVPILKKRIEKVFNNDLLTFLLQTDPANSHTSNFITNLAQKGKLVPFFPRSTDKQKKIIDLIADSAFRDADSLILFAATFPRLLQTVVQTARSRLVDRMLEKIASDRTVLSSQLQMILQHYLQHNGHLLSEKTRNRVSSMLKERGRIDPEPFIRTPFQEWLSDHRLESLSVFQRDDDGRSSFLSYCRLLIKKGYRPAIDSRYNQLLKETTMDMNRILNIAKKTPGTVLNQLFHLALKNPIVLSWQKRLAGTEIRHDVFFYQGKLLQRIILKQFLENLSEMFVQRGHSYWRYEQLFEPFETLLKRGDITKDTLLAKKRFLSIGSCGGIRIYRKLNNLFYNEVDILATVGTGKAAINNPYSLALFEIVAQNGPETSWEDISRETAPVFQKNRGEEYLQPGSLPAILHKMLYLENHDTDKTKRPGKTD